MPLPSDKPHAPQAADAPSRITDRHVVSQPNRVIRVERLRVSQEHQSSVALAISTGRKAAR